MKETVLKAELRDTGKGAARKVRRQGKIPAVLYGKGISGVHLAVDERSFRKLITEAGRHALIKMEIPGSSVSGQNAMIQEIQFDPIKQVPIHIDFRVVSLQERIRTEVPIEVVGEEALAKKGGVVQHGIREVEIEAFPTDVPDHIHVDVSEMEIGDHVAVSDLVVPEGIRILEDPEEIVVTIVAPKAAELEEETPAATEGEQAKETAGTQAGKEE